MRICSQQSKRMPAILSLFIRFTLVRRPGVLVPLSGAVAPSNAISENTTYCNTCRYGHLFCVTVNRVEPSTVFLRPKSKRLEVFLIHRGRGASEARPTGRRAIARPRGGVFALAKTAVSAPNNHGRGASEARPTGRRAIARPRGGVFALAKTAVSEINISKNCRERAKYLQIPAGMGICFAER